MNYDEAYDELNRLVERIREDAAMTEDEINYCVENALENTRPSKEDNSYREPKPKRK